MHCHVFFLDGKEIMKNGVGAFMRQASKNYSALSSEEKDELANVSSATRATEGSSRAAARIFKVIHKKVCYIPVD